MNEPTQLLEFREAFYRRERRSVPLVRKFVRQALLDWVCEEHRVNTDDVLLCVSELATNALVHGVPPGRGYRLFLYWDRAEARLRVEIHDSGDGEVPEAAPPPDPTAERGRGLMLVAALAAKWGVGERQPGKFVWCEFAAPARMFAGTASDAHHLP
ncbi:ATP-binding protein [Streptomyces sp. SID9727]|uniref:ATP-binding protein n=1 Tax=Streptomyces sp. SID9727 TaxID=2706114 RepID=UPI0013C8379B|nr:ATP-binding protein [Streptomyces sp. SID9727]NEC66111.1 ATP-binding protein [Streptomyces sp. SID9727]